MKDREPTLPRRDSERDRDQSVAGTESGEQELDSPDVEDAGAASDEGDQFNSLATTRVTPAPLLPESDDAIEDRAGGQSSTSSSGTSSKRTRSTVGDFLLVRKLGQGAMATVYKARQISFDRKVALKLLHKHVADNAKLVERFYREARILGQLDHPNIVQGYGVGEAEGFHYFAMEYISGVSLQIWLNKLSRLPIGDALHITIACARALEYAHEHGLVHRDIKPDNVLITRHGEVKVADLGMVKAMDEDMSLTQTGHAVGTPWYMPLEQAKNAKDVDGRSDIYALGCMLYYMLTGRPPFKGASIVEVIQAKELGTFPPARQFNAEVPDRLDLIIAKMTAKQPKHRYQHCREVMHDLEELQLAAPELAFHRGRASETISTSATALDDSSLLGRTTSGALAEWYVQVKTTEGDTVTKKLTTGQIFRMLETGLLSANAKASRQENTGFRSLATYKEFESVALALATRSNVDRQTVKFRQLYKQLEEEDEQRAQRKREEQALDDSIRNAFQLLLRAAWSSFLDLLKKYRTALFIAGGLVGGILILWLIITLVQKYVAE